MCILTNFRRSAMLGATLLLAGCGEDAPTTVPEQDPALVNALSEPILVDPDLISLNRANSAAAMPSQDGSLPTLDNGPEAVAAARSEALRLVGGAGRMQKVPAAEQASGQAHADAALTAATRVQDAPGMREFCGDRLQYTARWAALMPAEFPVYPRAAVDEAAGTDTAGCALRVINFETPVPVGDVLDFYYTRARAAGFSARHLVRDEDAILNGDKGPAVYVVYARRLPSGNTQVDLLTSS